ncbi:hypothetical protein BVX95_01695, partial [archaeon D22]
VSITIVDGLYKSVANRISPRKVSDGRVSTVINALQNIWYDSARTDFRERLDSRRSSIIRLNEDYGLSARCMDYCELISDPRFGVYLEETIEFVRELESDNPRLVSEIYPKNPNDANKLYLPLMLVEGLVMQNMGLDGKLSVCQEGLFDEVLSKYFRDRGIDFSFARAEEYEDTRNSLGTYSSLRSDGTGLFRLDDLVRT